MMMVSRARAAIFAAVAIAPSAYAGTAGVDVGRLVDMPPDQFEATLDKLTESGAKSVRVDIDLRGDPDRKLARYSALFDRLNARGVAVYALLDREIVADPKLRDPATNHVLSSRARDPRETQRWIDAYADAAEKVATTLGPKVEAFELLNEPNNWVQRAPRATDGSDDVPWVSPENFSRALAAAGNRIHEVRSTAIVVSGPLLVDDRFGDGPSQVDGALAYFGDAMESARRDNLWDERPPFDAIGIHPYLAQIRGQRTADDSESLRSYIHDNLSRLTTGLAASTGDFSIGFRASEVGVSLPADLDRMSAAKQDDERARQARVLDALLAELGANDSVRGAHVFNAWDFNAGYVHRYGIFSQDDGRDRPALAVFEKHARDSDLPVPLVLEDGPLPDRPPPAPATASCAPTKAERADPRDGILGALRELKR